MEEQFKQWLISQGYKERTPSGAPSTIYNYQISIHGICCEENISLNELIQNIANIIPKYDVGGVKEEYGKRSNSTAINALKRFSEFLNSESVKLPLKQNENEQLKYTALELLKILSGSGFRIEYGELSDKILENYGMNINPHFGFTKLLDKLNDICINLNLPLISVMVVEQTSQEPSKGFFNYARNILKNHPSYKYKYIGDAKFILKKAKEYISDCKEEAWDSLRMHLGIEPVVLQKEMADVSQSDLQYSIISKDKLKNKIDNFVDNFFKYIAQETGNGVFTQQKNVLAKGKFLKGIHLFGSSCLEFYETWEDKAAYFILYKGTEPVLELQLSRILFNNDDTITWYLRIPYAKKNKQAYINEGLKLTNFQAGIMQRIKKQQEAYDNNSYAWDNNRQVYEFLINANYEKAFKKLFSLLTEVEVNPQQKPQRRKVPESSEYPTDQSLREAAVFQANYKCEYDNSHSSFICKSTNEQYMEGHHLIPMGKQGEFDKSLDNAVNIFSLCPNCHKTVHYGVAEAKLPILEKLFNHRKVGLQKLAPELDLTKLVALYEKVNNI